MGSSGAFAKVLNDTVSLPQAVADSQAARDAAQAAQTAAETAAAAAAASNPGAPNGTAQLDASSKLLEAQVPERLTESGLLASQESFVGMVNVLTYGATGDGVTDDTAAFSAAAAAAAAGNLPTVLVPAPEASYLIGSDPTVPEGVSFNAAPGWFTGSGRLPVHYFIQSEGPDPRLWHPQVIGYAEPVTGETGRKWGVVGWVNYENTPDAAAAASVDADAGGVYGRGITSVKNGRVFGLVGLVSMEAGAKDGSGYGVSQAYACELDNNNNTGDHAKLDGVDNTPLILGVSIVSGGTHRPAEAIRVDATRKPSEMPGEDNRWHTALRVRGDAVKEYALLLDDDFEGVAARIPTGGLGVQWTHNGPIYFAEYQDPSDLRRKMWSQTAGRGYDFLNQSGASVLSTHDGSVEAGKPLRRKTSLIAAPATIDANSADVFVLSAGAGTITGISGGYDGQRITLINVSGGNITLTKAGNMRMQGGVDFVMSDVDTIELVCAYPTWFEVSRSVNA